MTEMTTRERIARTYEHKETDRVPIVDSPWAGTIARWQKEGMPKGVDWRDYFGVDKIAGFGVDITPRYERKVIEETDRYIIHTSAWGVTQKEFKELDSTPEFLDFTVTTPEKWAEAKARMTVSDDRIDWKNLEQNFDKWKNEGCWMEAGFWFGFDVTHSWMSGTETILIAMLEEPEWVKDMFNTYLDMCIAHYDKIWDAGYHFDGISWPDDMGYKNTTFFSQKLYRELLQPVHKRAVEWAHNKGIKAKLHSCGDIMSLLSDIVDTEIDALNPIEIKAGMKVEEIKKTYGDKIVLHGGVDAVLWDHKDLIIDEITRVLPILKENGGYIFASDHSIPNSVSLENFRAITDKVKELGKF